MELFRPLNEQEYTSLIRYLRAKILERLGVKADYEIDPTHLVRIAELKFGGVRIDREAHVLRRHDQEGS